MPPIAFAILAVLLPVALLGSLIRRSLVVAQPDEWLLCIRNGRLVKAGVGISLWRRPGDVVARFTSTVQRVSFAVDALSTDRLRLSIEGFILWSISAEEDGPFRAFQKLGLVNLDAPPRDLKSIKHLLSKPQHRAFQQLLGATVQRLAATQSFEDLLVYQDSLVTQLRSQLVPLETEMGIRIDQVEVLRVRPTDEVLLRQMSAEVEERIREEAASIHLQATEREKRRTIESEARIAREQAEARRQELEQHKALRLAQIEHEQEVKSREQEINRQEALTDEAKAIEVARAALEREDLQFSTRLDRIRREAEANRDAISAIASAEENKSQAVRDHELSRLVAEKVADALKQLPLREARWITVGPESPAGSLAALIGAARELTANVTKSAA